MDACEEEGVDRAKFKQPYDEFLAEALATNECAKLRRHPKGR